GGSGTIRGTLLGLAAIVILEDGLHLAALPAELAGISTGVLLVLTIALERLASRQRAAVAENQEFEMKNSQLAILCSTVIVGALIVAGSNWYLVNNLRSGSSGNAAASNDGRRRLTVAMMPKSKGDPYFISCRAGAEEAAKEFN